MTKLTGQMEVTGPAWGKSDRIPELDGLRGLAILLVLVSHYFAFQIRFEPGRVLQLLGPGLGLAWSGVDLFFVLSGFLIGGILMDQRKSVNYFSTFYVRRFWRIVPLYAAVCCSFWLVRGVLIEAQVPLPEWLFHQALPWYYYATLTQNIGLALAGSWFGANWLAVTWSLAIEEQFYLLAPVVLKWIEPKRVPFLVCLLIILGFFMRDMSRSLLLYVFPSGSLTAYVLTTCHMDGLTVGLLGAWAMRNATASAFLKKNRRSLLIAIALGFAGLWLMSANGWHLASRDMALIGYTWLAFFYGALLLYTVLFRDSVFSRMLCWRPIRALGTISYCLYLIHQPISGLCHWLLARNPNEPGFNNWPEAATTFMALVITLTLATLSWRYFEKPLLQRGHRHHY